jgi:hypothetical protein
MSLAVLIKTRREHGWSQAEVAERVQDGIGDALAGRVVFNDRDEERMLSLIDARFTEVVLNAVAGGIS